jgi:hypothetical protein
VIASPVRRRDAVALAIQEARKARVGANGTNGTNIFFNFPTRQRMETTARV